MRVYKTSEVRNIALIGGAKSGKTTTAEAMLFEGGIISRRGTIEDKNTVSDYREIELERGNSVCSTLMYAEYKGKKLNIMDTPGFDDFIGEVVGSLNVADTALMLVNAHNGVEVGTEITWRQTTKNQTPVIFVLNQLDHEKTNFDESLRQLKTQFGGNVTLLQYPVNEGLGFNTIIDLMQMKMLKYPDGGGKPEVLDIPADEMAKAENLQGVLIEKAAESDESLMEAFFENGTLTEEQLEKGLKAGIIARGLYPVFCVSAKKNIGVGRLMEFICSSVPAPDEMPARLTTSGKELRCNAADPTCLQVVKVSVEEHLGEIAFFKVYGGEVTEAMDLVNSTNSGKERISQLLFIAGKKREKVERVCAGDIAATIKLKNTRTGDTLNSAKNAEDKVIPIQFPSPKISMAIKPKNSSDDEKLGARLNEMHKVDQTLLVEYSKELKQIIIKGQGELHLNIAKWYLEHLDKIPVEYIAPKIPYRETITKPAKAMYRHKKQSGGAGQFGEVHMLIEPYTEGMKFQSEFPVRGTDEQKLPWGGKLVFNNCIVGGAIDARFLPAILKGIMEKIEEGPLTGSYARDIVVNVYDGKMHPVDSNELAFKLAGRHAFREAFKNAGPKILEPIYDVEVMVPAERMGDIMTDLQGRRAIIMGMDSEGNYQKIKAKVPLAEMNRYSTALSSLTSGSGTYSLAFGEYAQVPPDVQTALLKAYEDQEKEEE
jgi:elongation factor G